MSILRRDQDPHSIDGKIRKLKDEIRKHQDNIDEIEKVTRPGKRDYSRRNLGKDIKPELKTIDSLRKQIQSLEKQKSNQSRKATKKQVREIIKEDRPARGFFKNGNPAKKFFNKGESTNESGGLEDMFEDLYNSDDIKNARLAIYEAASDGRIDDEQKEYLLAMLESTAEEYADNLLALLEKAEDDEDDDSDDNDDNDNEDADDDESDEITSDDVKELKSMLGKACKDKKISCALKDKVLEYLEDYE